MRLFSILVFLTLNAAAQESRPTWTATDEAVARRVREISKAELETSVRRLVSFGTRHALSVSTDETRGAPAAARWILNQFNTYVPASNGRLKAEFEDFDIKSVAGTARVLGYDPKDERIPNVIARLQGTDPRRVILVSGHYDSRNSDRLDTKGDAPGANDDASGTAVTLELARLGADLETRASIWFVAFTAEELGLWGSTAMAQACRAAGIEIEAMITNDIVGGSPRPDGSRDSRVLRVFSEGRPAASEKSHEQVKRWAAGNSESDSPSRELARYVRAAAALYAPETEVRLIFRQDRFLRGGDHRPFNLNGYAAARLTEPHENYNHQHQNPRKDGDQIIGDWPEFVDFDYVTRVAKVNAAAIFSLARAPAPPQRVKIDVARLMNETRITWQRSDDPSIREYHVLMRRTHEPDWTSRRDLGLVNDVVLPESKDEWLFAIQAVDAAGRRSLPVFADV